MCMYQMHGSQSRYQEEAVNADGGLDHVRYVLALCVLAIVLHLLARPLRMRRQVKVPCICRCIFISIYLSIYIYI